MERRRVAKVRQHARNARHDCRETDDGVQRGDHLRELDGGDPAADDRTCRSTERRHCSELYEDLWIETDCGEGGEDTRAHT